MYARNSAKGMFIIACVILTLTVSVAFAVERTAAVNDLVEKAKIKMALKQYSEAWQLLTKAAQAAPKDPEIANLAGVACIQNGKLDNALTYFKRAIKLDNKAARPYNNLGAIYHMKNQYKNAIANYKKAIDRDAAFILAYYNLGNAYFSRRMYHQAIDVLHKVVQMDPEYLTKEHGGIEVAVHAGEEADRLYFYAKLYAQAKDVDKALHFLQKALDAGYKNFKKIREDQDFVFMHEDERYKALVEKGTAGKK